MGYSFRWYLYLNIEYKKWTLYYVIPIYYPHLIINKKGIQCLCDIFILIITVIRIYGIDIIHDYLFVVIFIYYRYLRLKKITLFLKDIRL